MADTKKMFIIILLIISVGIVASNFNLTGNASKGTTPSTSLNSLAGGDKFPTKIIVSPNVVNNPGNDIIINIKPGTLGAYKELKICRSNGACLSKTRMWCKGNFKCYEETSLRYTLSTELTEGNYYAEVYDYVLDDYAMGTFRISNDAKVAIPNPRLVFEQFNLIYGHINPLI